MLKGDIGTEDWFLKWMKCFKNVFLEDWEINHKYSYAKPETEIPREGIIGPQIGSV